MDRIECTCMWQQAIFGSRRERLSDCCRRHQTTGLERKKAIHDVCVENDPVSSSRWTLSSFSFDFLRLEKDIIAEDDPYFFLQVGEYVSKSRRRRRQQTTMTLCASLKPRGLISTVFRIDTQGRVIRMHPFPRYLWYAAALTPSHSLSHFSLNLRLLSADDRTRNAARLVEM
jgi:hypothetical protein